MSGISKDNEQEWSLEMYRLLSNVFGSKQITLLRQNNNEMKTKLYNSVMDPELNQMVCSGSFGEGLEFADSDIDVMFCVGRSFVSVFETEEEANRCNDCIVKIVMDNENTKLGFTKLRVYNVRGLVDAIAFMCEESYVSCKQFKEFMMSSNREVNVKLHGPCVSTIDDTLDVAFALRCNKWTKPAQQWPVRSRFGWPSNYLIKTVTNYGVLFVPKGCKESKNEDLEWRISFSVAEKLLIYSFTHTQMLCYAAMKCILKDLIQPKHPELLCSYFIKTIMFWLAEEKDPTFWAPQNMLCCFETCLKRLVYCVEYRTCLHYFISDVNFFECRFSDQQQTELLITLKEINDIGWQSIFLSNRVVGVDNFDPFSNFEIQNESNLLAGFKHHAYLISMRVVLHILRCFNTSKNIRLLFFYFARLIVDKVTKYACVGSYKTNKDIYSDYTSCKSLLLSATCCNALCAWSALALLFHCHGNYLKSKTVAGHCLDVFQSVKDSLCEIKSYVITKPKWGYISHFTEHYNSNELIFSSVSNLLPAEIRPRLKPKDHETFLRVHKNIETFSKIRERNIPYFCTSEKFHSCRELRRTGVSNIINPQIDIDLQDLLEIRFYAVWADLLEGMWTSFHSLTLLHFVDCLSSYYLNDIRGAHKALHNLETEINSNFLLHWANGKATGDLACLNKAKQLLGKQRR